MRVYKIILILITIVSLLFMSLAMFYLEKVFGGNSGYFIVLIFVASGFVLSLLTLFYHIKSFRYYRKSKPYKKEDKGAVFLRFSAVGHSIYCILFGVTILLAAIIKSQEKNAESFGMIIKLIMVVYLLYGIFSILETVLLRKRIKKIKKEQETKNEIQAIGS